MKSIIQAMLEEIALKAYEESRKHGGQVVTGYGKKREFYITLEQLENILKEFEG